MTTGKESIYPQIDTDVEFADNEKQKQFGRTYSYSSGMKLREYYAGLAMQGFLANPQHAQKWDFVFIQKVRRFLGLKHNIYSTFGNDIPQRAVEMADRLIDALNTIER